MKLFCAIVGVAGSAFSVEVGEDQTVDDLKLAIRNQKPNDLKDVDRDKLQLFLAKQPVEGDDGKEVVPVYHSSAEEVKEESFKWLPDEHRAALKLVKGESDDYINALTAREQILASKTIATWLYTKNNMELPSNEQIHVLVVVPMADSERRWEELLSSLTYKDTKRLCGSSGCDWPYQGASELVKTLAKPLVGHYNAWKMGDEDKRTHPLHLVLSGPGTGKSRMLDEMKGLLCEAAMRSEDQALIDRMNSAYMFRVTFENGTPAAGSLLNPEFPEYDISYRMLYQLSPRDKKFGSFTDRLNTLSQQGKRIEDVIDILAKLEKVDDVKKMTVILCVDGFQKLVNDGEKTCDFYRVMSSICGFLNSSTAFAICVCSATIEKPVSKALADSPQSRLFLLPPALCGDKVLEARTPTKKLLVRDMGGHGRALEMLEEVFEKLEEEKAKGKLDADAEINPGYVVNKVNGELNRFYPDLFEGDMFDRATCKEVVSAIISQRKYRVGDVISTTGLSVDDLRSLGLFRLTSKGCLECAFIFLVDLLRKMPNLEGELANFDDHITRSVTTWQHFEFFVGFYRQVKSIAFRDTPLPLSAFHAGARFGNINGVMITERSPRKLVQALRQHETKSSSGVSVVNTDHGDVKVSDMETIIINGTSASAGDLFMTVELTSFGGQKVKCNEVIQCKFLQRKPNFKEDAFDEEREKAVDGSDVFLLITSSLVDKFDLPPKCGIVSIHEFREYFGPFASRAFRSLLAPPDINKASYKVLSSIEGLGTKTVEKIVKERAKRKFKDVEDAVDRVCLNKKSKIAKIIRGMYSDLSDEENLFSEP